MSIGEVTRFWLNFTAQNIYTNWFQYNSQDTLRHSVPFQQFLDSRTYITLEIELEQPLVQKRETEIIAKR